MTSFLLRAHLALGATMAASALVPADALAQDPASQEAFADGCQLARGADAPAPAVDLDGDPPDDPPEKLLSPLALLRGIWG